ncbi:hypothetical protein BDFB_008068 [Asbolus verrucosus]|uniref:Uncharacterized protein n=1 Tax=Asbolus verrucosus TaxID=1661398 RepID=A0A482VNK6_ASBVE|nr:hypothetical protein BDFB_008068 [Asbolus verrucosus]
MWPPALFDEGFQNFPGPQIYFNLINKIKCSGNYYRVSFAFQTVFIARTEHCQKLSVGGLFTTPLCKTLGVSSANFSLLSIMLAYMFD